VYVYIETQGLPSLCEGIAITRLLRFYESAHIPFGLSNESKHVTFSIVTKL